MTAGWRVDLMLSLLSELRDPLERLVPMGAILDAGRVGLLALRGELSGLDAEVVFVWVLSDEKRLNVAERGLGDSAVLESVRDLCSRMRRSWSLCSLAT